MPAEIWFPVRFDAVSAGTGRGLKRKQLSLQGTSYGTPMTAGRLKPIAIQAPSNFNMNLPEWPG
jgi:hypothetical protein